MSEFKYTDEFFKEYEQRYMTPTPRTEKPQVPNKPKRKSKYKRLRLSIVAIFVALAMVITVILVAKPKGRGNTKNDSNVSNVVSSVEKPVVKPLPKPTDNTVDLGSKINSENAVLVNVTDNTVVAHKNSDARIYPASLTKILTLLVAVENIENFDDTFEMSYTITDPVYKAGASMAGFLSGEVITVKDLLYGAILPSGAEATAAIAIYVSGSEEAFVELMNKKVSELGITTAHFTNTSGLHNDNHYCTVTDMAVILRAAMDDPMCREILSTYQYTTSRTPQHPEGILFTSTLFSHMKGDESEGAYIKGGKTGFTSEAGNCIASFGVSENGSEYIFVTAKAKGFWKAVYDHIDVYTGYAK